MQYIIVLWTKYYPILPEYTYLLALHINVHIDKKSIIPRFTRLIDQNRINRGITEHKVNPINFF